MQVIVRNDGSEHIQYEYANFPVYIRRAYLSFYPNSSAISHWHDDVEFILILSGHMLYNVNGKVITLAEGEGIFVNARQLHYGFSDDQSECLFLCLIIHPVILCTTARIEQHYIRPVLENRTQPYLHLHPDSGKEGFILDAVKKLYGLMDAETSELLIQGLLYELWSALYLLVGKQERKNTPKNHHLVALKDMIAYIQNHYFDKITLDQICAAGNVGKTTCCTIFQKYINQTPITYLANYRLQKGIDLLRETDMNIAEISYEVGFSGASYFTETFHKVYNCTPTEYKRHIKNTMDDMPAPLP